MNIESGNLNMKHIKLYLWAQFILTWGLVICFIPELKDLAHALIEVVTQFAGWIFFKSA